MKSVACLFLFLVMSLSFEQPVCIANGDACPPGCLSFYNDFAFRLKNIESNISSIENDLCLIKINSDKYAVDKIAQLEKQLMDLKNNELSALKASFNKLSVDELAKQELITISKEYLSLSERNYTIPYIIIALISIFAGVIIWLFRRNLELEIDKVKESYENAENKMGEIINSKLNALSSALSDTVEQQSIENDKTRKKMYILIADYYEKVALQNWLLPKKKIEDSIRYSEKAAELYNRADAENSTDTVLLWQYGKFLSSFSYYYAYGKRYDKADRAIKYALRTLSQGIEGKDLDIIDNYLYVLKIFDSKHKETDTWIKIYETYFQELIDAKIWDDKEADEFKKYYLDLINKSR